MNNLKIKNFTAYWDYDHHYGKIELFFIDGQEWKSTNLAADVFAAMMSILHYPDISWHVPTRSLVKS